MTGGASDWLGSAIAALELGEPCSLVTVAAAAGSVPRPPGSKMLVRADSIAGSIGGGHLELAAIARARGRLGAPAGAELAEFALGPALGQCCGGRVTMLLETLTPESLAWLRAWRGASGEQLLVTSLSPFAKTLLARREAAARPPLAPALAALSEGTVSAVLLKPAPTAPASLVERVEDPWQDLFLFGAGHVGRALVQVLAPLPFRVRWIDARSEMFPGDPPANVEIEVSDMPRHDVAAAPGGACFLVMTHSHALDFEICDHVLKRGDFAFLGLIGSASKRASFLRRLAARGHGEAALARLTCPIGLPILAGKEPGTIAVCAAAQLLALRERSQAAASLELRSAR